MPFLYGYLQYKPVITKSFCWAIITLNVSLFVILYLAKINDINSVITASFHAQIICNFLSSTALFLTILIYSYYPSVFIQNHRLFDFTTYPFIGIGILTTFDVTILFFSYFEFDAIQNNHPLLYYGCFILFYIESCMQCIYFVWLILITTTDYLLGHPCNHKHFDEMQVLLTEQITSQTDPLKVDFIQKQPFHNIGMTILPGRTKAKYNRDLSADIVRLKNELNVDVVVTLIPMDELERCECGNIIDEVKNHNMISVHWSWRDKYIPQNIQMFHEFICTLQRHYYANQKMVIHCNGGVGRTGTTVACLLMKIMIANDTEPNDLSYVSKLMREARRPVMLRNPLQRMFCRCYFHHFCT